MRSIVSHCLALALVSAALAAAACSQVIIGTNGSATPAPTGAGGPTVVASPAGGNASGSTVGQGDASGAKPATNTIPVKPSNTWIPLPETHVAAKNAIRAAIRIPSEWGVDFRLMTPTANYTVYQSRNDAGIIPASCNKIPSAISAYLNASKSWKSMAWWIEESNNDASESHWQAGGGMAGVRKALSVLDVKAPAVWKNPDGSGLSYSNTMTATFLVDILLAAKKQTWYSQFRTALPKSCATGTLKSWFCSGVGVLSSGVTVSAKTGTLDSHKGVKCLAGYAPTGENVLVFAAIYNGPPGSAWTVGAPKLEAMVADAANALKSAP